MESPYGQQPYPPYGQQPYPPYGQQPYDQPPYPPYGQPYDQPGYDSANPIGGAQPAMEGNIQVEKPHRKSSLGWLWALLTFLFMTAVFLFIMSKTDTGLGRAIRSALGMKDPFRYSSSYDGASDSASDDTYPYDEAVEEPAEEEEEAMEEIAEDDDDSYPDYNGHTAVDLGLSVDWAETNIGSDNESGYGTLFEWSSYIPMNEWGGDWRLPTPDEFRELIDNCYTYSEWNDGNYGMYFRGPNGNSIFLPYTGFSNPGSDSRINYDKTGHYWSGQLDSYDEGKAQNMSIGDATGAYTGQHDRYSRQAVRPVIRKR